MRMRRMWWLAAGLGLLAGCESTGKTPKYVTNFDQIRPGMTQGQVRRLLGWPSLVATRADFQARVVLPDSNNSWSSFKQEASSIFGDGELWQYGTYGLSDWEETPELMDGSPKSFLIYFDANGHVIRARKPLQGPYGDPILYSARPSATPSPSELWSGDAFGRDKGNVGPTTQPR
jgi:hypothetical protein